MQWSCQPSFTHVGRSFHSRVPLISFKAAMKCGLWLYISWIWKTPSFQWSVGDFFYIIYISRPTSQNAFHLQRLIKSDYCKFYEFLVFMIVWNLKCSDFFGESPTKPAIPIISPSFFREGQVTVTVLEFRWATSWELWSVSPLQNCCDSMEIPRMGPNDDLEDGTWEGRRLLVFCFMEIHGTTEKQSDLIMQNAFTLTLTCFWIASDIQRPQVGKMCPLFSGPKGGKAVILSEWRVVRPAGCSFSSCVWDPSSQPPRLI